MKNTKPSVTSHDRFGNFTLMADKIRVKSTDKCFVVQSNDEAIKDACIVFCGETCQTGYQPYTFALVSNEITWILKNSSELMQKMNSFR